MGMNIYSDSGVVQSCNIDPSWISLLSDEKSIWKLKSFTFIFHSLALKLGLCLSLRLGMGRCQSKSKRKSCQRCYQAAATKDSFRFLCLCVVPGGFWNAYIIMTLFSFSVRAFRCVNRIDIISSVGIPNKKNTKRKEMKPKLGIKLYIIFRRIIRFLGLQLI